MSHWHCVLISLSPLADLHLLNFISTNSPYVVSTDSVISHRTQPVFGGWCTVQYLRFLSVPSVISTKLYVVLYFHNIKKDTFNTIIYISLYKFCFLYDFFELSIQQFCDFTFLVTKRLQLAIH